MGWYKKRLCLFEYILFCVPLSWFAKCIYDHELDINDNYFGLNPQCWKDDLSQMLQSSVISKSNSEHATRLVNITNFYSKIDKYEHHRKSNYDKYDNIRIGLANKIHNKYGWGVSLPVELERVTFKSSPKKSFVLIPDLKNFQKKWIAKYPTHLISNDLQYGLLQKYERDLVNNLLQWRKIACKHRYADTVPLSTTTTSSTNDDDDADNDVKEKIDRLIDCNVYYKGLLNYERVTKTTWDRLQSFCWSFVLKSFNFVDEPNNRAWRLYYNHRIHGIVTSHLTNNATSQETDESNKKLMSNYLKIGNEIHLQNSIIKHKMQLAFLTFPFHLYGASSWLIYDYRIEYLRLYLNYPAMTSRLKNKENHLYGNVIEYISEHFDQTEQLFKHLTPCEYGGNNRFRLTRLHRLQNVFISKYFEKLSQFAIRMIGVNLDFVNEFDNLSFVTSYQFIYRQRLNQLLKNKRQFDKQDKEMKQRRKLLSNTSVIIPNIMNKNWEFDFENYIRLALYDLNFSIIAIISHCTRKRSSENHSRTLSRY